MDFFLDDAGRTDRSHSIRDSEGFKISLFQLDRDVDDVSRNVFRVCSGSHMGQFVREIRILFLGEKRESYEKVFVIDYGCCHIVICDFAGLCV